MHITGSYKTKKRNSLKAVTRATTLGFLSHPLSYCFLKWTVSDNRNWRATQLFPSNLKVLEKKEVMPSLIYYKTGTQFGRLKKDVSPCLTKYLLRFGATASL
jgi:hypothetical protein